jgi:hypothetical protein
MNINDITNPRHPLFHKDYAKLRGLSGLFILQVCQTPTFRVLREKPSEIAIHIVQNMKVSQKNNECEVTGKAMPVNAALQNPGQVWISAGEYSHPALVAQVIIHEMIHSCFGLEHGTEFNRKMISAVNECFPALQYFPPARRSHRYDADWEIAAAMLDKGIFAEWQSAHEYNAFMEIAKQKGKPRQYQKVCVPALNNLQGRIVRGYKYTYVILADGGGMFEVSRQFVVLQ